MDISISFVAVYSYWKKLLKETKLGKKQNFKFLKNLNFFFILNEMIKYL